MHSNVEEQFNNLKITDQGILVFSFRKQKLDED